MKFEDKYNTLINDIQVTVEVLADHKGEDTSRHYSEKVLKPDDDFMFNLDVGHPSGSYVTEVKKDGLVSNYGHVYSFDQLELEKVCQLVDHLKEKYK